MKIGINCLRLDPNYSGGVTSYALGLLQGFAEVPSPHHFRLYATRQNCRMLEPFRARSNFSIVICGGAGLRWRAGVARAAALTWERPYRYIADLSHGPERRRMDRECDLIYTPSPVLVFFNSRRPNLLSMHDIQHLHYPEFFGRAQRRARTVSYAASARCAQWLQASSEFIRTDLTGHYGAVPAARVAVVPEGVDVAAWSVPTATGGGVRQKYGLPPAYLFFPAQLWPHKNHLTVLRALRQLRAERGVTLPLVLTGARFSAAGPIFDYIREHRLEQVHYLGKVPFADLAGICQQARFLITAVLYESSSLPVLEAAAAGTPVIASRTPPNRELGARLRLNLFDPLDVEGLARMLAELWDNPGLARAQAEFNRQAVGWYSWANAARRYLEVLEAMVAA